MLTADNITRINEQVANILSDAIDTLIEKVGSGHESDVMQLLINLSAMITVLPKVKILYQVEDNILKDAIDKIITCISLDMQTARSIARPFIGQEEETSSIQCLIKNAVFIYLYNKIQELSVVPNVNVTSVLSRDFQQLLKNTSTEDADQKRERAQRARVQRVQQIVSSTPSLLPVIHYPPIVPLHQRIPEIQRERTPEIQRERLPEIQRERRTAEPQRQVQQRLRFPNILNPLIQTPFFIANRIAPRMIQNEVYYIFLAGSSANRMQNILQEQFARFDNIRLILHVIPLRRAGLRMMRSERRCDVLLICDPNIDNATTIAIQFAHLADAEDPVTRSKILLVSETFFNHNRYYGFSVLQLPFNETLTNYLHNSIDYNHTAAIPHF